MKLKGSTHVLLSKGSGKIWTCSCWEKGNFVMINKFRFGQTWKIWPSPLSLSLYSTFKLAKDLPGVSTKLSVYVQGETG